MSTSTAQDDPFEDAAEAAYTAYCDARNGRDERAFVLRPWASLTEAEKVPWRAATRAVMEYQPEEEPAYPEADSKPALIEPVATTDSSAATEEVKPSE